MPDKKLTDNEIVKEIQGIRESMKRHIDLTNEMGQELLRIDEEYTGGSKIWLTTNYFKKVVKHFCHSNYLVKCLELVFDYVNRLQAENKAFAKIIKKQDDEISDLRKDLLSRKNLEESFSKSVKQFDKKLARTVELTKAEAYKEFIEKVKALFPSDNEPYQYWEIHEGADNILKELVGDSK